MPGVTEDPTVMDMLEVPAPVMEAGLKAMVTPEGSPDAVSAMAESKPPVTVLVMVVDPSLPGAMETDEGEAEMLKPGFCVVEPASALTRLAVGLPQPVLRS